MLVEQPAGTTITQLAQALHSAVMAGKVVEETYGVTLSEGLAADGIKLWRMACLGTWEAKFILGLDKYKSDTVKQRKFGIMMEKELPSKNLV